jgi:glutaminyl-peptide cyclotransferase
MKKILLLLLAGWVLVACKQGNEQQSEPNTAAKPLVTPPAFNADSAYAFVEAQVAFGPRAPGTAAHEACARYLEITLARFADTVLVQRAFIKTHDGKRFEMQNIIGTFNPNASKRILLAAHWDTRPRAENDPHRPKDAIDGANDGASGVAVLLEMARVMAQQRPEVGIDIIFFDLEDYGISEVPDSYCLGAQYWSANPHKTGYKAHYGILLDMVGGRGARFYLEGFSMYYAPHVARKVWNMAYDLGYSDYFTFQQSSAITDDHYYVNKIAGIPMIDIIEHDPVTKSGFGQYWHTHNDNMDVIDRATLHAVGTTVLHVIFQE